MERTLQPLIETNYSTVFAAPHKLPNMTRTRGSSEASILKGWSYLLMPALF
jgi:hypothetical protein